MAKRKSRYDPNYMPKSAQPAATLEELRQRLIKGRLRLAEARFLLESCLEDPRLPQILDDLMLLQLLGSTYDDYQAICNQLLNAFPKRGVKVTIRYNLEPPQPADSDQEYIR